MTICAEIGQNHCGDIELAKHLIWKAQDNGAALVKFQLYDSVKLYGEPGHNELSKEQAFELFNYGKKLGIEVFFSVFDVERVAWCEEIGVYSYKLAFSQRNNHDLIEAIRATGKPLLISGVDLYCVPKYPAFIEDLHFDNVDFKVIQGYSDHTVGLDAAKIAIARGAQIIEKHFCFDHSTGIDAPWSMTPAELAELKRFEDVCSQVL